ncbi:hypothetical protein [Seonamhaeicola sp.]|uniref:hypothetical protein n=1 Tax=Seonamhaeicola sp. TaxID=1912245 RepID=UPI00261A9E06|nr:hypothetical protein [Seonamhaeicola sp.]
MAETIGCNLDRQLTKRKVAFTHFDFSINTNPIILGLNKKSDLKKVILLTFLINCTIGVSQTKYPFYEQIAFDFYKATIIDSFPSKKKIKVYPYVTDFHLSGYVFSNPRCLGITWKSNKQFKEIEDYVENQWHIDSDKFELDFSNLDKKKFKIKRSGKGNYPRLFITAPNKEINGTSARIFVNIHENYEYQNIIYHLEFNENGQIKNWCRTVNEIVRIY